MEEPVFEPKYPAQDYIKRPNPNALLSPLYDWTFKAMFTQETEESNIALKSFLSAVLGRKISSVILKSEQPPKETKKQRSTTFDVCVEFDNGEISDIEMQAWKQNYDYGARAEVMAARLLSNNAKKGKKWQAPDVYQISVLNFHYEKDDKREMAWYTMKDNSGKELADKLNIIFIDLVTIRKRFGTPVEELSPIEKWGLFLSYIDDHEKAEYINNLVRSENGIMAAGKIVKKISKSNYNWYEQNSRFIAECDYNTIQENLKQQAIEEGRNQGLQEGRTQGLQEGIQKGIQQGIQQNAMETAIKMLKMKYPLKDISEITGLPQEKILELQKTKTKK